MVCKKTLQEIRKERKINASHQEAGQLNTKTGDNGTIHGNG